jgi:hypothetical protein
MLPHTICLVVIYYFQAWLLRLRPALHVKHGFSAAMRFFASEAC